MGKHLGELIKKGRKAKGSSGLSLEQVAGLTGINYTSLSRYELGQRIPPDTDRLEILIKALDLSPEGVSRAVSLDRGFITLSLKDCDNKNIEKLLRLECEFQYLDQIDLSEVLDRINLVYDMIDPAD